MNEGTRIYVATRKGLFTVDRAARGWTVTRGDFLGINVTLVLQDPRNGAVYAAVRHEHFGSKVHRSAGDGAPWEERGAPVYPEKPAGLVEKDGMGIEVAWSLKQIWALAPGHPDRPDDLWCGTIPGGLFRSSDSAKSWSMVRSLWDHPARKEWFGGGADYPGIHSVLVDPRDPKRVALGVSCGGVWLTLDDGTTWNCRADGMRAEYMPPERQRDPNIQDPHLVVQCPARPEVYWAQHHNGIFRSGDDLVSWREIEGVKPSTFGFAVAVHPKDPDTAWFVPAAKDENRIPVDGRVVVTRTRDGGKKFEILDRGLPGEHAYDLVYRHALDVDEAGNRLSFGSTTGSLWVSENQGDAWTCVTNHLPPIHCVRFAKGRAARNS